MRIASVSIERKQIDLVLSDERSPRDERRGRGKARTHAVEDAAPEPRADEASPSPARRRSRKERRRSGDAHGGGGRSGRKRGRR